MDQDDPVALLGEGSNWEAAVRTTDVIAAFPGPMTLYRSLGQWAGVFCGSATLSALGAWLVADDHVSGGNILILWPSLVAVAVVTIKALLMILPGAASVTLRSADLEIVNLWRHSRIKWKDTSEFAMWTYGGAKWVVFNSAPETGFPAALRVALMGYNATIPDNYGLPRDMLLYLMNRWRTKALAAQNSDASVTRY